MIDLRPTIEDEQLVLVVERSRRRLWLYLVGIAAVLGLVLGVAWAAGVVSTEPDGSPSVQAASPILGAAPSTDPNPLQSRIVIGPDNTLPMDFTGRWGAIPADADTTSADDPDRTDHELFEVDLSGLTGNHYVEIGVANDVDDFNVLQIAFVRVPTTCALADFDAVGADVEVLAVDTSDSVAVFSGLTSAASDQCIGVESVTPRAADSAGTFIRRSSGGTTAPDPMPAFFAVLQRST